MAFCSSFAPAIDERCRILILGSMPGVRSLAEAQYYAHPYNRFWPVMAALCRRPAAPSDYAQRLRMLNESGFALWDVLKFCQRNGSLDSAITGEEPNDLPSLVARYPLIRRIAFNGGKARSAYKKYFPKLWENSNIEYVALPSTSPANARWHLAELTIFWREHLLD